jgi:hypothetical protein
VNVRLGDGKIVRTNRGEELWSSLSGTYGTMGMGIVLEAAVECVEPKPYVRVSYYCFGSIESATEALMAAVERKQDVFLEGLDFPTEQVMGRTTAMMKG